VSGSRLTMTHRSSFNVTPRADPLLPSPNINVRPTHPSSSNGSALSVSITTLGRNLRRSQRSTPRPDSRATECTVPRLITEIQASSKMPCLRFINSTSLPYRLEISSRSSSLRVRTPSRPAYNVRRQRLHSVVVEPEWFIEEQLWQFARCQPWEPTFVVDSPNS
jgi:hypothetical protein